MKSGTPANATYRRKDERNDRSATVKEEEKNADMRIPQQQNRGEERSSNTGAAKPQQNRGGERSSNTGATTTQQNRGRV
jgi:hypothetical protein